MSPFSCFCHLANELIGKGFSAKFRHDHGKIIRVVIMQHPIQAQHAGTPRMGGSLLSSFEINQPNFVLKGKPGFSGGLTLKEPHAPRSQTLALRASEEAQGPHYPHRAHQLGHAQQLQQAQRGLRPQQRHLSGARRKEHAARGAKGARGTLIPRAEVLFFFGEV